MSDGTLIPVQADSQGRLVCEGLQGVPGPEGPQGPPGPEGPAAQWPPNPQNGDVLAWDNGPVWVSGVIPVGPPWVSDSLLSVSNDLLLTFASSKNLEHFTSGFTVIQTTGYQPVSSQISAINTSPADYTNTGTLSGTAAGFQLAYPLSNMFDGQTTTFAYTNNGTTTYTFASPISFATLRMFTGYSGASTGFMVNAVSGLNVTNYGWSDFTDALGEKTLRSITTELTGSYGSYVYAIEVDGQILRDSDQLVSLTVADDSGLINFRDGDPVTAGNGGSATGVLGSISGTTLTLASSSGTWATSETVVGPTLTPPSGVIDSVDAGNSQITLQSSDVSGFRRWAVGVGMTVSTSGVLYGSQYKAHR